MWVDRYDNNNPGNNTFTNEQVNLMDTLDLSVTKNWLNDFNNYWGTRPVDSKNETNWKVDYQLQQSIDNNDWYDFDINEYGYDIIVNDVNLGRVEKYQYLTGELDTEASDTVTYSKLPAGGILKITDASGNSQYVVAKEFQYRVLEKNTDQAATPLNEKERFNNAYVVTYETGKDEGGKENPNHLIINNTMQVTSRFAEKKWADANLKGTVTFELEYLSDDGSANGKWIPFTLHISDQDKSATVTLDGKADTDITTEKFWEYESWKAKWINLPDQMPGSKLDEKNQTKYRVVEVITDNNAYGLDVNNNKELDGSGTDSDPYVLVGSGTSEDNPFTVTNEFTKMRVSKTVTRPASGEINTAITEKEFTFTITPDGNLIPNSAKYQIFSPNESGVMQPLEAPKPLKVNGVAKFNLKDGQYALIYGLKKDVDYTVTETPVKDDDGSDALDYKVTYKATEYQLVVSETGEKQWKENSNENDNSVKLTSNKPTTTKEPLPTIDVTNERLGKITITKTNLDGTERLNGMEFKLEVYNVTEGWIAAKRWSPEKKAWEVHGVETSKTYGNQKGLVIFKNLELDKKYRLTETVAPGHHKYPISIEFVLPYNPDLKTTGKKPEQPGGEYYYTIDGEEYYPEIKMTIENDDAFLMPDTSGTGFFWPGMIGVAVSVLSAGGYVVTRKKKKREEEENEEVN